MEKPNIKDYQYSNGEMRDLVEYTERLEEHVKYLESLRSNYEVRKSSNGDLCIMTRKYNTRIATFVKGSGKDADNINKLL